MPANSSTASGACSSTARAKVNVPTRFTRQARSGSRLASMGAAIAARCTTASGRAAATPAVTAAASVTSNPGIASSAPG